MRSIVTWLVDGGPPCSWESLLTIVHQNRGGNTSAAPQGSTQWHHRGVVIRYTTPLGLESVGEATLLWAATYAICAKSAGIAT